MVRARVFSVRTALAATTAFGLLAGLFAFSTSVGEAEGPAPVSSSLSSISLSPFRPLPDVDGQAVAASTRVSGSVARDELGLLPLKVRAVGSDGAVCGTGGVSVDGLGVASFELDVVSSSVRASCPEAGEALRFVLLYGAIGDGRPAVATPSVVAWPGRSLTTSLAPVRLSETEGWSGALAPGKAWGQLTWLGPDGVSASDALLLLDGRVSALWRFDAGAGRWDSFLVGAPSVTQSLRWLSAGDVVFVWR